MMPDEQWKGLLKHFIETSYENVLRDIPATFDGLSKQEKKAFRRQLKIIRRRAAFDMSLGVAVIVGNGYAVSYVPVAAGVGLGTSAAGGAILFRRGGHAFIASSSSR